MALTKASLIDLNSNELILDLDADTSITADTDDTIHFKIAGSDEITMTAGAIAPSTSDGNALGTTSLMFSDLFLASGSVVNFNNGDVTLTHSSNTVTLAGGTLTLPDSGLVLNSTAVTSTAAELNLIDGGTSTGTTAVADADGIITNDGGTMRLTTAATFKTYFQEGISTAYDDLTAGDAAVLITTSSGNITIDAAANDSDIILKGTDGGVDTTFLTIDGSAAGAATFNAGIIVGGASQLNNAVTVGVDDTGYDVKFFGATSGKSLLWDESADTLIVTGNATISGTATTTGVHTFTAIPLLPDNTVSTADIQADAITNAKIADDQIDSEHYVDGSIDTAHLADGQVTIGKLATAVLTGATDIGAGIADADLFLVDDGAGGTLRKTAASRLKTYIGSNAPAFCARESGQQTLSHNTHTNLTFGTEEVDSDGAFASNVFTVPSGQAGKYYIFAQLGLYDAEGNLSSGILNIWKGTNGTKLSSLYSIHANTNNTQNHLNISCAVIADLAEGNVIGASATMTTDDAGTATSYGGDQGTRILGFKLAGV
jgi:hypothetical protein